MIEMGKGLLRVSRREFSKERNSEKGEGGKGKEETLVRRKFCDFTAVTYDILPSPLSLHAQRETLHDWTDTIIFKYTSVHVAVLLPKPMI